MTTVEDLRCPGCGCPVSRETKRCDYCGRAIEISSFGEIGDLTQTDLKKHIVLYNTMLNRGGNPTAYFSQGVCYLKLKLYDKALESFENAISTDFTAADAYFYAAVCVLKGKRPFVLARADVEKAENYLENAVTFNDCGIYRYFQAFIRHDYYSRKFFKVSPDYKTYLSEAKKLGVSEKDVAELFDLLNLQIENLYADGV